MPDFEEVRERESEIGREADAPGGTEEARALPPAHEEPESRRRARVERMILRGRPGVSYPRTFRARF